MKKLLPFALVLFWAQFAVAQNAVEISRDANGSKVLKGLLTERELATDTAFHWFVQNQQNFTPDAAVVKQYAALKDSLHFIVFGGTWCDDTKNLLPRFFATVHAAGIPDSSLTIIGVDRNKKTLFHLSGAFAVTHVPTLIALKNGKEIGRVVEYGRMGLPEKELAEMISAAVKK